MEENEDQRQFFRDLAATAEQTVEEVRAFEENYYSMMQGTMSALPWTANIATRLQSHVEQDFRATFAFALADDGERIAHRVFAQSNC